MYTLQFDFKLNTFHFESNFIFRIIPLNTGCVSSLEGCLQHQPPPYQKSKSSSEWTHKQYIVINV